MVLPVVNYERQAAVAVGMGASLEALKKL